MSEASGGCFVGLDMGTTNTRAWLVVGDLIAARCRTAVGVRDAAVAGSTAALRSAVGALVAQVAEMGRSAAAVEPSRVFAAGMITSPLGLAEVPHVAAPAGLEELAAGMQRHWFQEIGALEVWLIPGVRTGPERLARWDIGSGDVMRGEETLCAGLIADGLLPSGGTLLNLGSHWKVIRTDVRGRVAASTTSLSGELLHAAQTRTVLAGSVPAARPEMLEEAWVRAGIEEVRRSGLARALFCVRLLEQRTPSSAADRLSFLAGAFIGAEITALTHFLEESSAVVIAGGGPLGPAFATALGDRDIEAAVLRDDQVEAAMVRGLRLVGSYRV